MGPTVIVVALICVGVWMFSQDGPHAPTTRSDSEATPATKLIRRFSSNCARAPRPIFVQPRSVGNQTAMISQASIVPSTPAWNEKNPDLLNSASMS